ncbi:hypothetical protein [Streptomyces sp. NPDC056468]|uniref:hypothetical protein n=1 Tax=Streptomyces sp. NPDC056468 TaxID=3345830 RepID=UPI0036B54EB4
MKVDALLSADSASAGWMRQGGQSSLYVSLGHSRKLCCLERWRALWLMVVTLARAVRSCLSAACFFIPAGRPMTEIGKQDMGCVFGLVWGIRHDLFEGKDSTDPNIDLV